MNMFWLPQKGLCLLNLSEHYSIHEILFCQRESRFRQILGQTGLHTLFYFSSGRAELGGTDGKQAYMRYFGLDRWLDAEIGGFGHATGQRAEFIASAIARAKDKFPEQQLLPIVIGDTPFDIQAAKELRLPAIAVAGGIYPPDRLAAEHPRLVIQDYHNISAIERLITELLSAC
jgi:hypothetical protein